MKTTWNKKEEIERKWYLVDVDSAILGRAATQVARLLIGKGKVNRVPNIDCGDHVVVVNASKIQVSGKKLSDKKYYRHSGYPGGFKEEVLGDLMENSPDKVFKSAVWNMLPKTKWRDAMISRLYVFSGDQHDHGAQKPENYELKS